VYMYAEGEAPVAGQENRRHQLKQISYNFLKEAGVALVAFNSVKTLHSMSPTLVMECMLILEHVKRDPDVRAVVWTATGTKAFCSGAAMGGDQKMHVDQDVIDAYAKRNMVNDDIACSKMTKAFWDCPKTIIMAVNGLAVGGGANIALANFGDIVFCSKNSRFMWPFGRLGLTPELGSSMVMPAVVGMAKAKELMMGGDWISAEDAVKFGLANGVHEPEQVLVHAVNFAAKVATTHPATARLMKQVLNATLREKLDEVMARESATIIDSISQAGSFIPLRSKL